MDASGGKGAPRSGEASSLRAGAVRLVTTIACDGLTMAGDGRSSQGGTIINDASIKIVRLKDGRLAGFAGYAGLKEPVRRWLEDGGDYPKTDDDDTKTQVLLLDDEGAWLIDALGHKVAVSIPAAIGSGADHARAAMLAGANAEESVAISAKLDIYTGGKITVLHK